MHTFWNSLFIFGCLVVYVFVCMYACMYVCMYIFCLNPLMFLMGSFIRTLASLHGFDETLDTHRDGS